MIALESLALDHRAESIGRSLLVEADAFDWLAAIPEASLHAIVTDPPYGLIEYQREQIEKRALGIGGVWRIPPSFDGHRRSPLPRFTALTPNERVELARFFRDWSRLALRVLKPGGHVFLASNAFLSQAVFGAVVDGGLEYRGQVLRLVRTLRGGDRPKNAEAEFPGVSSLPRGGHEPWGLFRKPIPRGWTVGDCLRRHQTGGLRRSEDGLPFTDVILSERTPRREKTIADHPSLKPQSFLRAIVHAALPLGQGIIADPFMGSGSTVAAAEAVGVACVGIERNPDYFEVARTAVPRLARLELAGRDTKARASLGE